ncbi:MAG: bacillithiol system protein YtxJ [Chitinophagales bacterium]|jgi:bacillithiol system protein YtxJ
MISTWKILSSVEQLEQIEADSHERPVALFKHSTSCGISLHSKHNLESAWDINEKDLDFYYLDLLNHRDISNEIAQRYNVVHQSPQVVLLKEGKAIFDTSHNAISVEVLKKHMD